MNKSIAILPLVALVAACGGNDSGSGGAAGSQLKIVGSSTVYPFTTAVRRNSSAPIRAPA